MTERPKQFANRDDPIPVLSFVGSEQEGNNRNEYNNDNLSNRQSLQRPIRHAGGLEVPKKKFNAETASKGGDPDGEGRKASDGEGEKKSWRSFSGGGGSIQDQLYKLLFQSVVASEEIGSGSSWQSNQTGTKTERPAFSLPVMSTNFRRFNARIGVAFVFQNRLMKLFSWRRPTQTLSFLAMYSFICLDPSLLPVLPIMLCIFFIAIPSYLVRHPASPIQQHDLSNSSISTNSNSNVPTDTTDLSYRSSYFFNNFTDNTIDADLSYDSISSPSSQSQYHLPSKSSAQTPPTKPPPTIRPTPEISRDFFRNMRDLQNSMEDFSRLHDTVIATITPLTNFSNEARSSALFVALALLAGILIGARHIVPWRAILLTAGWVATGLGHPGVQKRLMGLAVAMSTEMTPASAAAAVATAASSSSSVSSSPANKISRAGDPPSFRSLTLRLQDKAHAFVSRCIADDIILFDTSSENSKDDYDNDDIRDTYSSKTTSPERHQVEIFELQKQQQQSHISSHNKQTSSDSSTITITYSSSIFSPSPYPPFSTTPSSLDSPNPPIPTNTSKSESESLSSILPPPGPFRWADERWTLDTRKEKRKMDDGDKMTHARSGRIKETEETLMTRAWVCERGLQDVMSDYDSDDDNGNEDDDDDKGWVVDRTDTTQDTDTNTDNGLDNGNQSIKVIPNRTIWRRRRWVRCVMALEA